MSAHTPGPWWLHREYSTVYVEGKARDPRVTQEVAAVGPKEGGREQQEADAYLIAAAPELLEMALELKAEIELIAMEEGAEPYNNPRLNAVLAKATGAA